MNTVRSSNQEPSGCLMTILLTILSVLLEKGGVTFLKIRNGFTLIEVIAATAILLNFIAVVVPVTSTLLKEKTVLHERRTMTNALHDQLQVYLWDSSIEMPQSLTKVVRQKEAAFLFEEEREFIKGCVTWENAREINERFCLYGLSK